MAGKKQGLKDRRIVVTRASDQNGQLREALEAEGAEVLELPLIEIVPHHDPIEAGEVFKEMGRYEWLVFTSKNGVEYFFEQFLNTYEDIRSIGLVRIACIGAKTAEALAKYHLKVDLLPEAATGEALGAAMADAQTLDNLKILVITGNRNRPDLIERLEKETAIVDTLQVYTTRNRDLGENKAAASFREKGADMIVFASSSAVESFRAQAKDLQMREGGSVPGGCSFGPQTSEAMRKLGVPVTIEAKEPSIEAVVKSLKKHFAKQ